MPTNTRMPNGSGNNLSFHAIEPRIANWSYLATSFRYSYPSWGSIHIFTIGFAVFFKTEPFFGRFELRSSQIYL
jgi:hypothetical protein